MIETFGKNKGIIWTKYLFCTKRRNYRETLFSTFSWNLTIHLQSRQSTVHEQYAPVNLSNVARCKAVTFLQMQPCFCGVWWMKTNQHHFASIIERLSALYKVDNSFEQSIANYPSVKIAENFSQRNLLSLLLEFSLSSSLHVPCTSFV